MSRDELYRENLALKRTLELRDASQPTDKTGVFVLAVVVLSGLCVLAILGIDMLRPARNNTVAILTVIGVFMPLLTGLLSAAVRQVHIGFNSRMSELLLLTAKAAHAEGELVGAAKTTGLSLKIADDQEQQRVQGETAQATADDTNRRVRGLEIG